MGRGGLVPVVRPTTDGSQVFLGGPDPVQRLVHEVFDYCFESSLLRGRGGLVATSVGRLPSCRLTSSLGSPSRARSLSSPSPTSTTVPYLRLTTVERRTLYSLCSRSVRPDDTTPFRSSRGRPFRSPVISVSTAVVQGSPNVEPTAPRRRSERVYEVRLYGKLRLELP